MKKLFLIICTLIVNCLWAQKPVLKTNSTLNNTVTKPATVNNNVLKKNPGIISTNSLKGTPFVLKRIVPMSGSVSKFKMIKGNGKNSENPTTTTKEKDDQGRFCTTTIIDASRAYTEQLVLGNQNDKIFPGAIYYENSFVTGSYNAPSDLKRAPYNISTSLFSSSSNGSSTIQVEPNYGAVNNGIGELMRRTTNVVNSSSTGFEVSQISSSEQLAFELGAGYEGYGVELSGQFNYLNGKRKNVYFAKLVQVYFSVNANTNNPADLLTEPSSNSTLVYVNKVNYGRIAIIQVSSEYSEEEVRAALNFAYSGSGNSVNADASINYNKVAQSSEIRGMFFGGDATNTIEVTSIDQLSGFNNYVRNGLRWDSTVTPTPVSFQLKYMNDNSVASTQATTTFPLRNCESAKGVKIKLHGIAIDDTNNTCGCAWGNINVKVWETDVNGIPTNQILPSGSNPNNSNFWSAADGTNPIRVLKYSELKQRDTNSEVNMDRFNAINYEKTYTIDPELYANNRVIVQFTMKTKTDHKDNDFASRGFPEMPEPITKEVFLKDIVTTNETIRTEKMIYTYKLGGYTSNTDRQKIFHAMFSITPAN